MVVLSWARRQRISSILPRRVEVADVDDEGEIKKVRRVMPEAISSHLVNERRETIDALMSSSVFVDWFPIFLNIPDS